MEAAQLLLDGWQIRDTFADERVHNIIPDEGVDFSDIMSGRAGRPVNPPQASVMMDAPPRLDGESDTLDLMSDDQQVIVIPDDRGLFRESKYNHSIEHVDVQLNARRAALQASRECML